MRTLFMLTMLLGLYSCQNEKKKQGLGEKQRQIETGELDSANQYKAEQVGWTLNIHPDWEVQSKEDTRKNQEKGQKAIEKTIGLEVDASGLVQLINLRKGRFNSFLSTMQAFDEAKDGPYAEINKMVYEVMKQTYDEKGMTADYTEDSTTINGLPFNRFRVTIYKDKDKSQVILYQVLYSRLLNGYDFGMTTSYQDEQAGKELESMVRTSKFAKRQ